MAQIQRLSVTVWDLLVNPKHTSWLCPLLLLADGALTTVIIKAIPYTEIDWTAYMQQIEIYRSGERDYANIKGQTGPLVYPAGHVYVYDLLYRLTDGGSDVLRGQYIFGLVYLATLGLVMSCYKQAKAPPYIFGLSILSKRLHSIFVLRLFNDCFAILALFMSTYFYQTGMFVLGSLAFSFAVSVKMSMLLAAPGVAFILMQKLPTGRAMNMAMIMLQLQFVLGLPFISANYQSYLGRAFELTRQFLFKWTVNWKFLGPEVFESQKFALGLLFSNGILLLVFAFTRWTKPSGLSPWAIAGTVFRPLPAEVQESLSRFVSANFILTTVLSSLVAGLLCARTLHYQFFAYIAWATPYLLWKARLPMPVVVLVWAAQEIAWNVYPATTASSLTVVGCLLIQVIGVWYGTRYEFDNESDRRVISSKDD